MTSRPVRVLLAHESAAGSDRVARILAADSEVQVTGPPVRAADAVRTASRLRPDVVVVVLGAPDGPGIDAIGRIMAETPVPVVACLPTHRSDVHATGAAALRAGALTVISVALDPNPLLTQSIKNMAAVRVVRRRAARPGDAGPAPSPARLSALPPQSPLRLPTRSAEVIAIGASTGGPQTLEQILTRFPASFTTPILVVQHIDPGFVTSLVSWLRPLCALPLRLAAAGEPVSRPGVAFAPPERHLSVRGGTLVLSDGPPVSGHRPSANVLFESVAREYGAAGAGVLLTGMGDDGADGLRRMKDAGAVTIAQDAHTSIVYGMPRAAVELGAATHVLPPVEIAALLLALPTQSP